MQEAHTKKIYACTFEGCTSVFNRAYRLAQHRLVHVNVKPFVCHEENCTKSYTSKSHLNRHFNSTHRQSEIEILFCCPMCMKKYASRQNLKRHMKANHNADNKTFICDYCKHVFKQKDQLIAHMYQHTGVKAFRCPLCFKKFISLTAKKKHMRNHKVYKCEHCSKPFNLWCDLVTHKRMDHQSPEYICNDCQKVFKDRSSIIRHVKCHNPKRPFKGYFCCPYQDCPRFYTRSNNLKHHILFNHQGQTYDCSLCGAKLSTKAKLKGHMERHKRPAEHIVKPLKTNRKLRSDANTIKISSALKLAGLVEVSVME